MFCLDTIYQVYPSTHYLSVLIWLNLLVVENKLLQLQCWFDYWLYKEYFFVKLNYTRYWTMKLKYFLVPMCHPFGARAIGPSIFMCNIIIMTPNYDIFCRALHRPTRSFFCFHQFTKSFAVLYILIPLRSIILVTQIPLVHSAC